MTLHGPNHDPQHLSSRPEATAGSMSSVVPDPTAGSAGLATDDLYRLLVESVQDYAIFALDPTGHIMTWNIGARRIKGYAPEEIIGKHFSIFYPAVDVAADKPGWELQEATRVGRFEDEGWRIRKDGRRFWASVIITALFDEDRRLVGFAKVTRDLTTRRATEQKAIEDARQLAAEEERATAAERRARELGEVLEQLRRQSAELDRRRQEAELANRTKSEFLAAMSHELRTPLNAIGGYAELLSLGLRGPLTDAQRDDLQRIRLSQQRLLGIINDILNFSRVEAGRLAYDLSAVAVREVFAAVTPLIELQAHDKGLSCSVEPCDAIAYADRAKVEQILINLLSNAVKFTPAGGSVSAKCSSSGLSVCIQVTDTGVGIPEDQLDSIFEPFVQIGRGLARPLEGTGLGLAISRDLATGMNGELTVESTVGAGSTFTLTLPKYVDPAQTAGG
jgi:PAS domain S-box-containing protein